MKSTQRSGCCLAALGLGLALLAGCQTYVPGASVTLPSGRYLEHPPQYIPPSPPFPLPRELAALEAQAAAPGPGLPAPAPMPAPVPPPVPPVPLPPPGP
jgi:hypothetical protein